MTDSSILRDSKVTIIGAGLVGSLLACYLARYGARVEVVGKRPDLRCSVIPGGRTIARSLSSRGWRALDGVGLQDEVRSGTQPTYSRYVHLPNGATQYQRYGCEEDALWTVKRKTLNFSLLDRANTYDRVRFRFDACCRAVDPAARTISIEHSTGETITEQFDYLIAADGMNLGVRAALREHGDIADEITTLDYRYFELTMPSGSDGTWVLSGDCVHVWPRSEGLVVALPNPGGTFSGTFFYARGDNDYFGGDITPEKRSCRFYTAFPSVAELIPDFEHELATNPASDIKAIRCWPWHVSDRVFLVGDACHAIVPFFAVGMNLGFEDCIVFDELVTATGGDLGEAFARFPVVRRPDTDAIGDLSLRNFMSIGRSADPDYDRRWRLECTLWSLFPDRWTPLYALIHFGGRPLGEVVRQQEAQAAVLRRVVSEYPADGDDDAVRLMEFAGPLVADDVWAWRTT